MISVVQRPSADAGYLGCVGAASIGIAAVMRRALGADAAVVAELSPNGALAQEQCLRLFAVGAEEKEDEPDQQPGIDERHPHDEAEAEIAARIERTGPEGRKRGAERSLGGVVGAHEDFKKRHQAPSRGGLARRRG